MLYCIDQRMKISEAGTAVVLDLLHWISQHT